MKNKIIQFSTTLLLTLLISACTSGSDDDSGVAAVPGTHQVLAFNDLGMHCADLDYSTFVILPPFNVLHSQVIERGATPRILADAQINVSYRAVTDAAGSINSTSQNQAGAVQKSNFWDTNPVTNNSYVFDLFGLNPAADEGLALDVNFAQKMPGILAPYSANDAQPFNRFDTDKAWFAADGVPILPIDDAGQQNAYPLMRVSATEPASGETVASLDVVLPVASEADCQNCHALGEVGAQDDSNTLDYKLPNDINDPNDVLQAAKHNILVLHDAEHGTSLLTQKPVLCARCHYSAALDLAGTGPAGEQIGKAKMSEVMHGHHGELTDATGNLIFPTNGTLEETCYQCHPGKVTKCLRGAMGGAGIECQDCHGSMLAVGRSTREPWIDEPRCESCHTGDAVNNSGLIRFDQAWTDDIDIATPRLANNKRFAENKDTLYRNSLGHGGVACEGCHGSTHAIWPNALASANDNVAATQLQGHAGTISECSSCHTSLPLTLNGPHGMHNVNSSGWNTEHEDFYESNPDACRACHGLNLEGTVLSETATDRIFLRDEDDDDEGGSGQTITVVKGTAVSCDMCHEKP
jgi:hypothetical protein